MAKYTLPGLPKQTDDPFFLVLDRHGGRAEWDDVKRLSELVNGDKGNSLRKLLFPLYLPIFIAIKA